MTINSIGINETVFLALLTFGVLCLVFGIGGAIGEWIAKRRDRNHF